MRECSRHPAISHFEFCIFNSSHLGFGAFLELGAWSLELLTDPTAACRGRRQGAVFPRRSRPDGRPYAPPPNERFPGTAGASGEGKPAERPVSVRATLPAQPGLGHFYLRAGV